jgi:hypothetical protein
MQTSNKAPNKKFNYKPYLLLVIVLLVITVFSPYLFSKLSFGVEFNDKTGPIGDTIGGITAPFLNLIASLLVFATLRAQIQANDLTIERFEEDEREKIVDNFHKLEILVLDLESVNKDISQRADAILEYVKNEKSQPFKTNLLIRTASKVYIRLSEIERLAIYKGFKYFECSRETWLTHYDNLYRISDFLPEVFNEIYSKYDKHVLDLYQRKISVREQLIKLMDSGAILLGDIKERHKMLNFESFDLYQIVNEMMIKYYQLLEKNEHNKEESDFEYLSVEILETFNVKALELIKKDTSARVVEPIMIRVKDIRTNIHSIKEMALQFAGELEKQHTMIAIGSENKKSLLNQLVELRTFIQDEMGKVNKAKLIV